MSTVFLVNYNFPVDLFSILYMLFSSSGVATGGLDGALHRGPQAQGAFGTEQQTINWTPSEPGCSNPTLIMATYLKTYAHAQCHAELISSATYRIQRIKKIPRDI